VSAWYNEKDAHAAQWLRNLIEAGELPEGVVDERSIVDLRGDDLAGYDECHFFAGIGVWARAVAEAERAQGRRFARPLFTGSCPCQPLSAAGQRKGHADERHLWPAFHNLIAQRRPATIIGEQVASKDGREWMAAVRADLEVSGYAVGTAILPACGVGAPHLRYRLFFVAQSSSGERGSGRIGWDEASVARPSGEFTGPSDTGFMADAGRERCDGEPIRLQPGQPRQAGLEVARSGATVGLAHAQHAQRWPVDVDREDGRDGEDGGRAQAHSEPRARGEVRSEWPGPPDSFWDAADWLYCRDGKWRPIGAGIQCLVDGAAFKLGSGSSYEGKSRAGMLRGYGNAVVLPVARAFIEAALEAV
jgi:DNA (cytosine-5)-methyltransferase 1